jgi:hypothetical protein
MAAMAYAPNLSPYHNRVRGVFLSVAPISAGFLLGAAAPAFCLRRMRAILLAAALILLAALWPRLRTDIPSASRTMVLGGGLCIAVVFVRIGMLQAGVTWGGREADDSAPRWAATLAIAFAWAWLGLTVANPRETFAPTRWLLTATGDRPSASALAVPIVTRREYAVSSVNPGPDLVRRDAGMYRFALHSIAVKRGEAMAAASVERRDGAPLREPMWLSVDVADPIAPAFGAGLDRETALLPGDPSLRAVHQSGRAKRLTAYAWFGLTQSAPSLHVRVRLWAVRREHPDGGLDLVARQDADFGLIRVSPRLPAWLIAPRRRP